MRLQRWGLATHYVVRRHFSVDYVDAERETAPLPVRLFGWFLIVGGLVYAAGIIATGGAFSPVHTAVSAVSKAGAALAGYGFVTLKRWGVFLYFIVYAANTTFFFVNPPSPAVYEAYTQPSGLVMMFLVPAAVAALVGRYWARFS